MKPENRATYLRVMGAKHAELRGHPDEWENLDRLLDAARAEGREQIREAVFTALLEAARQAAA